MTMVARYSKSRKKSCQACALTKSKCDRNPAGCRRCTSRQLTCSYPAEKVPLNEVSDSQTDNLVSDLFTNTPNEVAVPNDHSTWSNTEYTIATDASQVVDSETVLIASVQEYNNDSRASHQTAASYQSSDLPAEFDFSNLELICPIDADSIKNRWLNCYVPVPGQIAKTFSTNVSIFVHNMLKSYAASTIRGRSLPPFLHPSQTSKTFLCPVLSTCLSLVRLCDNPLPGSEKVAVEILHGEMGKLYEGLGAQNDVNLLATFQAYLLYCMALYFRLGPDSSSSLRQYMMNLQDIACFCSNKGLVCLAEQRGTRPKWEAWLLAEAKRRTLYTMYLFDNVLSIKDGLPTFLATEVRGLPAPASKTLWDAQTRGSWEKAYNIHLADWTDGSFCIDELWPTLVLDDEFAYNRRRRRLDRWLENVDGFGTMMYAVTSCVHDDYIDNTISGVGHQQLFLPKNVHKIIKKDSASSTNIEFKTATRLPPMKETSIEVYSIFDKRQRALIVFIVSIAGTFSGFASNIYFPAIPTIAADLNVSIELIDLTVTSYLIFQGIAPSLWGPVSDVQGRRVAYICTFLVFFGSCIGLANSKTYTSLVVLRCLQSAGSSSTIAIGSGVIGDITTRADRGGLMGVFQAGLLVPVAAGPVIGGALAGSLGWRSVFWFLTIYSGVFLAALVLLLPETLRSIVGNGTQMVANPLVKYPLCVYQKTTRIEWKSTESPKLAAPKHIDVIGPFRILISKQAAPILVFLAIYYAVWQMSITAMSSLFKQSYGLGETEIGLTFIANGGGSMIGTLLTGKLLNLDYRRVDAQYKSKSASDPSQTEADESALSNARADTFPLEKARLRLVPAFAILQCLSILLFGWTIQYPHKVHIAVPIISTFITGWTLVSGQSAIMTYLVDVHHERSAAASASLNLARCLFAAGGTSFVMPMIDSIGVGMTFTVCAIVQAIALVLLAVQWTMGHAWRQQAEIEKGRASQE